MFRQVFRLRTLRVGVLIALILFLGIATLKTEAVGVRPLVADLYVRPGEVAPFEIVFSSSGFLEILDLVVYEPRQLLDGTLSFVLSDPAVFPSAQWVSMEQWRVVVRPGQDGRVLGEVHVPFDAGGTYPIVVMVEPEVPAATGVTVRVRYAVRLQVHVERAGLRPVADLLEFDLVADEQGAPALMMHVHNPSPLLYDVSGEVTIRDETRRLVERVAMHTEWSKQVGVDATPIYPGADVKFFGEITEPLYPGDYEVRLFMRYGDGRQIVQTRKITLVGDEFDQTERMRPIAVEPERISLQMRPGQVASVPLQFRNRTAEELAVSVGMREISPDYGHSVFEAVEFQSRGETAQLVEGRRSGRSVLIIRAPRDIDPGGYYGYIEVAVFDGDDPVDTVSVPVELVVPGPWEPRAEVLDFTYEPGDELSGAVFSVLVGNLSNVHFRPSGFIYLNNADGDTVRTMFLDADEDVPHILPDRSGYLIAVSANLEPGEYTAEVHVQYEQQDLDVVEFPLVIQESEEE